MGFIERLPRKIIQYMFLAAIVFMGLVQVCSAN
jgi:hypothetical protein